MDYKVTLHTGDTFTMNGAKFDADAVTNALNSGEVRFINLGGAIVELSTLAAMLPITHQEGGGVNE